METVSKMKYSRTDRLVLGIGYAILGLFVLSIVVPWSMLFWHLLWIRRY